MKRIIPFSLITILFLLAYSVAPAAAQVPAVTPTPASSPIPTKIPMMQGTDVYTFSNLGKIDQIMDGPYDSLWINFSVPSNWQLNDFAVLQLHINNSFNTSSNISQSELVKMTGAKLDVEFDGTWLTTVLLNWSGEKVVTIPFSARSVVARPDSQHYLALYLDAAVDCDLDHQTTVAVLSDSSIKLAHDMVIPQISLVQFPIPLYQDSAFFTNTIITPATYPTATPAAGQTAATTGTMVNTALTNQVTIPQAFLVTPDNPDLAELQSALIINAGLGRLTVGNLPLTTIPISKLTEDIKKSSHLIFVGKGPGFAVLKGAKLPAVYDGTTFKTPKAVAEDGLIQEAVSPWDTSKVILVVSGESDAGILKAAKAVSSGVIMPSDRNDLAIVSNVIPGKLITTVNDDRTLADLKYETIRLDGTGIRNQKYLFYIPPGQTLRSDAYFKLSFTNSPFLDQGESALSVYLNNQAIGGVRYSVESSRSIVTEQINIPGYLLRAGMNQLTVETEHKPMNYCSGTVTTNLWTSISNQSLLHIPLTPVSAGIVKQTTLSNFLDFLSTSPTLDSTGFVVAKNSPDAIKTAAQIAYQLGSVMTGDMVELDTAYADAVPEDFKKDYDLVVVGRASQLPILSELGSNLPAQFDAGSDVAQETVFRVIYRISPGTSVGYLELLAAPWNSTRNILAVLGSTDEGLNFSANALMVDQTQKKLGGNYAVIRNDQVITGDTRMGTGTGNISATLVPDTTTSIQVPTDLPTFSPAENIPFANRTDWILPVVGGFGVLTLVIILIVIVSSKRKSL
jgi:cellulose synthase operon protein B